MQKVKPLSSAFAVLLAPLIAIPLTIGPWAEEKKVDENQQKAGAKKEEAAKPKEGVAGQRRIFINSNIFGGKLKKSPGFKKEGKLIFLGLSRYKFYYSFGTNFLINEDDQGLREADYGAIAFFRMKRTTNYTFYDLRINGYYVPRVISGESADQAYADIRLKRSVIFFDWPWLYDWTVYQLKSSTLENLRLRALLETGFGAFLLRLGVLDARMQLNLEAGVAFDYASLDAYAENISSGLVKVAIEFDVDYYPLSSKNILWLYYQVINPDPLRQADQTRVDLETNGSYYFNHNVYLTAGLIFTSFLKLPKSSPQPSLAFTVYSAFTYKH